MQIKKELSENVSEVLAKNINKLEAENLTETANDVITGFEKVAKRGQNPTLHKDLTTAKKFMHRGLDECKTPQLLDQLSDLLLFMKSNENEGIHSQLVDIMCDGLSGCSDHFYGTLDQLSDLIRSNHQLLFSLQDSQEVDKVALSTDLKLAQHTQLFDQLFAGFEVWRENLGKTVLLERTGEAAEIRLLFKKALIDGFVEGAKGAGFKNSVRVVNQELARAQVTEKEFEAFIDDFLLAATNMDQFKEYCADTILGNEKMIEAFLAHCQGARDTIASLPMEKEQKAIELYALWDDAKMTDDEYNELMTKLDSEYQTMPRTRLRVGCSNHNLI